MMSCVKLVSSYHIPVFEIIAARALISLLISYVDIKRKRIAVLGSNKMLLFTRGTVGSLALLCIYYSVTVMPLAEATILQYLHPVFTAALAVFLLKERLQFSTVVCIVFCLSGLLVMVSPNIATDTVTAYPIWGIIAAVVGSFGSAIAYIIVKKLSRVEDSSVIIFYFPLVALPLSLILLGDDFVMPNMESFILLVFVGLFTQIGQVGMTKAMQYEVASKVTAYSYIQVVFAMVFGILLFSEVPSVFTLVGGGLILTGAFINVFGGKSKKAMIQ